MTWFAPYIPSVVSGIGTVAQVAGQMNQAKAAEYEAEFQAEQEKLRAQDEAIERRERLLNALAMQNAKVGGGGITTAGTPTHLMETDIERFDYEDLSGKVLSGNRINAMKAQGANKASSARLGAGLSLIEGIGTTYSKYPSKPASTTTKNPAKTTKGS